jgi:AraC family transcriptional regulator
MRAPVGQGHLSDRDDTLVSVRVFDGMTDKPTSRMLSSEGIGWHGVLVRYFVHPSSGQIIVPGLTEDFLLIVDNHVADLQGKLSQRFQGAQPSPGDLFVIPRGEPTEWGWQGQCQVIQISPDQSTVARAAIETLDIEPARVELVPRISASDPLVYQIGLALFAELRAGAAGSRLYIDLLTQTLTVHLLRAHAAQPASMQRPVGGLSRAALRRVTEYVIEHLSDELRLGELAAVANLSQYHFARLFRRSTGYSVHNYVVEQRLQHASRLLNRGMTLAEVAAQTGFADQSHLARRYRAYFGVSPRAHAQQRTKSQQKRTTIQADENEAV